VHSAASTGAGADQPVRCEAVIDLAAVRANIVTLRSMLQPGAALMAVVKADGYGHGAVQVARAAVAAGADSLGVATLEEAVALRDAGIHTPLVAWLWVRVRRWRPACRSVSARCSTWTRCWQRAATPLRRCT